MRKFLIFSAAGLLLAGTAFAQQSSFYWNHGYNPLERNSRANAAASGDTLCYDGTSYNNCSITETFNLVDFITWTAAPSANSATTNNALDANLTSPVDTTGTNTHNGVNVDLTISNATGGTNSVRGFNVGNVTGDAQVDVTGVRVGTGTTLGTSRGLVIDSGWDAAAEVNVSAAADSAQTNYGVDLNLTTPVDTTGTNTHIGLNIDTTIGNATAGTNTATAINIANVTGDAQVTETGIAVGTGFDVGISTGSPLAITDTFTIDGTTINEVALKNPGRDWFNICGDNTTVNNNTVYYGPSIVLLASSGNGQTCDINAAGDTTEATADAPVYTNQAVQVLGMTCRNEGDANANISYTLRTAAGATTPSVTCTIADGERDCVADVQTTTAIAAGATVAIAAASSSDVGDNTGFVCNVSVAY